MVGNHKEHTHEKKTPQKKHKKSHKMKQNSGGKWNAIDNKYHKNEEHGTCKGKTGVRVTAYKEKFAMANAANLK